MEYRKYAVVYFLKENIYSEIPVGWLTPDLKSCWWPNSINPKINMARCDVPDKSNWTQYEVQVESYASTLESARRKAENPDYRTGDETTLINGKRRTKKTFSSSDSNDEGSLTPPPSPKVYKKASTSKVNKIRNKLMANDGAEKSKRTAEISAESNCEQVTLEEKELSQSEKVVTDMDQKENDVLEEDIPNIVCKENSSVEDVMFAIQHLSVTCSSIHKYVVSIDKRLRAISVEEGMVLANELLEKILQKIPLKNIDELKAFDKDLSNIEDMRNCYVKYMKQVGGRDVKDNVNRCLSNLLTNKLGTECSYVGYRGNLRLQEFTFMKFLLDVIMIMHKSSAFEVEKSIGEWFRLSNQRLKREKNSRPLNETEI